MTRRDFLRLVAVSVPAALFAFWAFGDQTRFVQRRQLRSRLGDFDIADEDLDAFFEAFEEHYGAVAPEDDDFLHIFMMSTDAFDAERSDRALRYVRLYHPYVNPCHNPLARRVSSA